MHPQFKTEGYAEVAQHYQNQDWQAMNEEIQELLHDSPEEDHDVFLEFLIASWPNLKGTASQVITSYYLSSQAHHELTGMSETIALEWGICMNELGYDADARTLGFARALHLFPDSEPILKSLINGGFDCDDYYCEDAFSRGATSLDPDRNIVLNILQALSDYNYSFSEDKADGKLTNLNKELAWIKESHPGLHADHLNQAMVIVEGYWQLPDKDAVAF